MFDRTRKPIFHVSSSIAQTTYSEISYSRDIQQQTNKSCLGLSCNLYYVEEAGAGLVFYQPFFYLLVKSVKCTYYGFKQVLWTRKLVFLTEQSLSEMEIARTAFKVCFLKMIFQALVLAEASELV